MLRPLSANSDRQQCGLKQPVLVPTELNHSDLLKLQRLCYVHGTEEAEFNATFP